MNILAISGSLRAESTNKALLKASQLLVPCGMRIHLYDDLAFLPPFNPDCVATAPLPVLRLHRLTEQADGLLIACPEYMRGIPGAFKNALDWLVSNENFSGKPVALFNASPRASDAQASLRLVLQTMAAHILEEASLTLPLLGRSWTAQDIAQTQHLAQPIARALTAFSKAITALASA